jgi:type IV pilus assembly protein PilV
MDITAAQNPFAVSTPESLPYRTQSGFSLIEVLVAIVILSVGMLGAVGMQATALQSNKETRYQAIATTFGRELAEKMRGNNSVAIKTVAAQNPYLFDATLSAAPALPGGLVNCFTSGCTSALNLAVWDVFDWQQRVQLALPTPRVKVCFDDAPFDSAGKARWACAPGTGATGGNVAVLKMSWTRNNTAGVLEFAAGAGVPVVVVPLTAGSPE